MNKKYWAYEAVTFLAMIGIWAVSGISVLTWKGLTLLICMVALGMASYMKGWIDNDQAKRS